MKAQNYSLSEQSERMGIICNIQLIQHKIHGKNFAFESFNGNTTDELRELQNIALREWNEHLQVKN